MLLLVLAVRRKALVFTSAGVKSTPALIRLPLMGHDPVPRPAGTRYCEISSLANLTGLQAPWVTGQSWTTGSAPMFGGQVSHTAPVLGSRRRHRLRRISQHSGPYIPGDWTVAAWLKDQDPNGFDHEN
jgi:hypothetical protein